MKSKVYIETSVVSYLIGRPSNDLIAAARQIITFEWWNNELPKLDPYISRPVIDEAQEGDSNLAISRLNALKGFNFLEEHEDIAMTAQAYLDFTHLPEKCRLDCIHMATASVYSMDFLVSWNCKHIVNAVITGKIRKANDSLGLATPEICTPEELFGGYDD